MRECLDHGARLATNGEFTKRAFLNGKMSLSSAEGMMDMINAESDAEVRAGYELLTGNLSKLAYSSQEELTDILSEIEVSFDYPEEIIEYITKAKAKERLQKLSDEMEQVIETSETGKMIKSGINVLIIGKPNVGKSSLLNNLLQKEKAIVTDVAGTTRDTIEGTFLLDDIKINLIDTAGIHNTEDKVEKIGVDKAKNLITRADIVLFLIDSNREYDKEDEEIFNSIQNTKYIIIRTKTDLEEKNQKHFENEIEISALTGNGIDKLKNQILQLTKIANLSSGSVIITNERHKNALIRANESLKRAIFNIEQDSLDLISIDIKQAYIDIGEITGNTTSEEIIDAIFSKFCLGK
jgi:tRNA modification GTPase